MKKKKLEKSGLLTFSDFSDLLNQSGRRTVNSDTYIINDLKMEDPGLVIDSSSDDDADVTVVTINQENTRNIQKGSGKYRKNSDESCSSSGVSSQDESSRDDLPPLWDIRRRSSGVIESLRNFMCVGHR